MGETESGKIDYFPGDNRTNFQRMMAGENYIADEPEIFAAVDRATKLVVAYHQAFVAGDPNARDILVSLLGSFGAGSHIKPPLFVDLGSNIHIGNNTYVNSGLTALDVGKIIIGDDCLIGPNVQLLTPTHPIEITARKDKVEGSQPITLGNNVWLGGGVIVCPGVTIGDDTVVGAGAVVTKDLPAGVVAVGNPARVIRAI